MTRGTIAPGPIRIPAFLERYRTKICVAFLLSFVAGLVDVVGYLGIFHMFTAHMTGTTVELARNVISSSWADAQAASVVVGSFFLGSVFGRAVIQVGSRMRLRRVASVTILTEALLVLVAGYFAAESHLAMLSTMRRDLLLAVLATSMGLQTATLTGVGPLTVHTTFVTGMLNKLAQFVSRIAFRTYDFVRAKSADDEARAAQKRDMQEALFIFLIWSLYLAGAVAGSCLYRPWGLRALYFAVALLLSVAVIDQFHPLSIEEEKEQSER